MITSLRFIYCNLYTVILCTNVHTATHIYTTAFFTSANHPVVIPEHERRANGVGIVVYIYIDTRYGTDVPKGGGSEGGEGRGGHDAVRNY